jgi:polysaccharide pyruvyl transferase WcaK-like protein
MASTKTVFRDRESYEFARDTLGVPSSKIEQSVDGLFTNPIWRSAWRRKNLRIDRKKYKRVVGVNILSDIPDWVDRDHYIAIMRQFVASVLERGDYVVFIPFQTDFNPRNDLAFMTETFADIMKKYKNHTLLEDVPIDLIHSYMTQCDVLVGMRFHSLLLASACGVPFVAVAYDTKCWRFIKEIDYSYAVKLENLQYDELMRLYDESMNNRKPIQKQLKAATDKMYHEAEDGLRTLNL